MSCKYEVVMFDLDGTISDSAKGVADCITAVMQDLKKPVPDLSDVSKYVGPPLVTTFEKLCKLSGGQALNALERYRNYYEKIGKPQNKLFTGIDKVIEQVNSSGAQAVVATSKLESSAREVLELLGISHLFSFVCGSNINGDRKEKAEIIEYIMKHTGCNNPEKMVLIGDTGFDAAGAKKTGCNFIGVTYGCGTKEQMHAQGARNFAHEPEELISFLFKE